MTMSKTQRRWPGARSLKPGAADAPDAPPRSAYVEGLMLLGRRELSESQVRTRLARRGYETDDIDAAIERLKEERSIDDARVAGAIARTQTSLRHRGRRRVRMEIEKAGIAGATALAATDEVFDDLDPEVHLAEALGRRLRGDRPISDDREFQRLYRYLVAQGFESDRVLKALAARRRRK